MIMSNTFYPVWQLFAQNRKYQVCVAVWKYWKFSSHRLLTTEGDMFAMGGKKKRGISDYLNFPPIRMEINFWPQAVLCLWWVARGEGERGTSRQMYIREETCSIFKHCQRHNGPEGCVLLTKVTKFIHHSSYSIYSYHKVKHKIWSSFVCKILTKHQLQNLDICKHQHVG